MISSEKLEIAQSLTDSSMSTKSNKWNDQPHIGKYKLIKTIGKGNFAKVKLAQHVTTGKKVAVKVIDKTSLNNTSLLKLFREVKIMKTLEHPNIVKLFEVIESERHVYLVMEYASRGEVFDFLVQNGRMKEKDARQRFREIVSAIQYCHQKNIVHRDLKAENLLLSRDLDIKIADFGFANNFDSKKQLDTFCGSPPYAAPELFQGRKYDGPEVDVWSLGVILYTLVSGSLPFDGHNMRELRDRVLKGKYRIPFYMTTDCESLLKKMLIVNPQKRYTLLEVMKDKWINLGYEDSPLKPYKEPPTNYEDPVRIAIMENLGFSKEEVLDSLYNAKFNNVTATYLLLDHDVNSALENNSKSASVSSLKNVQNYLQSKDASKVAQSGNEKSGKAVARSGSAAETRGNTKLATIGDQKDVFYNKKENQLAKRDDEVMNTEAAHKYKADKMLGSIKQSPSMGATNTHSNDEVPQTKNSTLGPRPTPLRLLGIQPHLSSNTPKAIEEYNDMNSGDNLTIPTKNTSLVKRNNTFTYADKNTASDIESKPVTRTKHVLNMLISESSTNTPTVPLSLDQTALGSKKHSNNDENKMNSKYRDTSGFMTNEHVDEALMTDSVIEEVKIKINGHSVDSGDHMDENSPSDSSNIMPFPIDDTVNNSQIHQSSPSQNQDPVASINSSATTSKDPNDTVNNLNKPRHSNSLFRSFTNKISSSKLIRRLTSQNPHANRNKRSTEYDTPQNTDPWTPMDTTNVSNDKTKTSASSGLDDKKNSSMDRGHQIHTPKPNQNKPRLMHLIFRKNLSSKLRPDTIISEMLKSLSTSEEIEFTKVEQIDSFVIECQGQLRSESGGKEPIRLELEVFRLPRSSSFGIRIKKQLGSSTRFKAMQKILVNRLSLVLCADPHLATRS